MEARPFGYTIFKNPSDFPNAYVVRGWDIDGGKTTYRKDCVVSSPTDTALKVLRESLRAAGRTCVGREPEDDPVIVEVWI